MTSAITETKATPVGAPVRQEQMGKVFGYLKGLHATHLINVGVELGLFNELTEAEGSLTPLQLATRSGCHPPYVKVWCEAAFALELLDLDGSGRFTPAPFINELLADPSSTYYLGGFPGAHLAVAEDYAQYPHYFRTGSSRPYQEHSRGFFAAVAAATTALPRMFCDAVLPGLPALNERLEHATEILDVGCGAGHAIVELAKRYPGVRCLGVDIEPESIAMAEVLIAEQGLGDRVAVRLIEKGWPADLVGRFDLITQFLVLHEIEPRLKQEILRGCADALKPSGALLLFDERYPSEAAELRDPAQIFSVVAQWYELTLGNVLNTREEISELLHGAGLTVTHETALSRFHIVIAERAED